MKLTKPLACMLLAVLLLLPLGSARADAAPPMNPPGGDVSPEGGTQVQMTAEQVVIDFRPNTDDSASVSAWFLFHNTGDQPEHLKVRFPLNGDPRYNQDTAQEYFPLIQDFKASLGSQVLATQTVKDDDPNAEQFFLGWGSVLYWAVFEMDFPAGQDVKLNISYTLKTNYDASSAQVYYILASGAGWKGPIGKVDVILLFPYVLNEYNYPDLTYNGRSDLQSGRQTAILENQVRIHYDDLEPTSQDNVNIWMMQPHLWQEVLRWRVNVISTPNDPQAWAALSRAYAAAGQEHHGMFGNQDMAEAYILATERALTLDPGDVSLHLDFAQTMFYADLLGNDYYRALALNELATAEKLDPTNPRIAEVLQYSGVTEAGLPAPGPFPTPPAPTPTPEWVATPTNAPVQATSTLFPTPPPTSLPTVASLPVPTPSTGKGSSLPTGWAALIGLILLGAGLLAGFGAGWFLRKR